MSDQKVTVRVTRKLIDWALTQTSTQCGISLALKDAGADYPRVTQTTIAFTDRPSGLRYTFKTPQKLVDWIDHFDRDPKTVKPVTFTLDLAEADRVREIQRVQPSEAVAKHQKRGTANTAAKGTAPHKASSNVYRPLRDV